ncbi:MAG: hypothetical protein WAO80_07675 [Caldicoprobacterales bacterium]
MQRRKKIILPKSDNQFKEGLILMIMNLIIFIAVGIISVGLFWIVHRIRLLGFPLPLPVWLVILGTGIPSCIFWFQFGKIYGTFVKERPFVKGLTLGIIGNVPGFIILYVTVSNYSWLNTLPLDPEIIRITYIIFLMLLVLMPIMVLLGSLDKKPK